MNALGLAGLNKLMIIYSHAEIVRALRVVADIRNHPVMIHCASGRPAAFVLSSSSFFFVLLLQPLGIAFGLCVECPSRLAMQARTEPA
jgi:hypothetical protein